MSVIYKWLPIIFGCHTRDDRSFHIRGKKMPLCARCTGELIGIIIAAFTYAVWTPPIAVLVMIMLPLIIDGSVQLKTSYESNNIRRLWTGILFGYALCTLFVMSTAFTFRYGREIGGSLAG